MNAVEAEEYARVERERDLYLKLLDLGQQSDPGAFLEESLRLIVEVVEARQGYLEIYTDESVEDTSRWWIGHGFNERELEGVRAAISTGIIAESVASGHTIVTDSALLDPRFKDRASVMLQGIGAVLCTPIGDEQPSGVLYLQRGTGEGSFSDVDLQRADIFARHLTPLVDRLICKQRARVAEDLTRPYRQRLRLDGVVGKSAAFASLLQNVSLVAPLEVSVLLTGESGTGKSHIAQIIHENGPRAGRPFVELSCAALPETLVESELFGALPGAHSTAGRRIEGKVAAAERGTLFLDEIGELPLAAQAKLLLLLQSKQYYPLGGAQPVQANVRVIAATNVDLEEAVAQHRFREDLYYRLKVLPIAVPTLAERREDIRDLAVHFCQVAAERHKLPRVEMSSGALRAAELAEWPGNVRQLAHAVEAAVIRAVGSNAAAVERQHLFAEATGTWPAPQSDLTFQEATRRFQANLLAEVLEETGWNVIETARRLDLARSHTYTLIRAFALQRRGSQSALSHARTRSSSPPAAEASTH